MTAEKLHDAIGLLSADLVAEADAVRKGKPRAIHWKRWTAMAACLCMILLGGALFRYLPGYGGGAKESAAEAPAAAAAAPMEQAADEAEPEPAYNGMGGEISGSSAEDSVCQLPVAKEETEGAEITADMGLPVQSVQTPLKPSTACFSSSSQVTLVTSREELETYLTEKDWIFDFSGMADLCAGYDEGWFEEKDLLLIAELCAPAEGGYTVTAVTERDGVWEVCIGYDLTTEEETAAWHILLEVEKGQIPNEDAVVLIYE